MYDDYMKKCNMLNANFHSIDVDNDDNKLNYEYLCSINNPLISKLCKGMLDKKRNKL